MPLNFAIIGCGNIGKRHAEQIQSVGNLVAVCDIIPERTGNLAGKYQSASYGSVVDLFEANKNIDVAVICTPSGLHAEQSIRCLQAGYHVLCEKPMALNSAGAYAMIQVAKETGKHLWVVKQNRFNPPVQAVKSLLDENKLGRIFSFQINGFWNRSAAYFENSWRGKKDMAGGTLFTQFSHFIDLACWFFGDLKAAKASVANQAHPGIEIEDCGSAIMEFENGINGTLNYTINAFGKNMEGSLTIFAEKGTVKIGGEYLNLLEYQLIDGFTIPGITGGEQANDYGTYKGSMSNHHLVYRDIIEVLEGKKEFTTDGSDGLRTVKAIETIYKSANYY